MLVMAAMQITMRSKGRFLEGKKLSSTFDKKKGSAVLCCALLCFAVLCCALL